MLTPLAKTRSAWNDAPDTFDYHLIENKQGAQRYFYYIPITPQVFASEVIAVEKLLQDAKNAYMKYGK